MKKLFIVTTVPISLATLIKGQPKYLSRYFDVELVCSDGPEVKAISAYEELPVNTIELSRKITPLKDLKSLLQMYRLFRDKKPDIVYTFTPKAGLIGMLAAFFAGVPVRIHNIVGMPLMEARGIKRSILKLVERVSYFFSTALFANSVRLKEFVQEHLTRQEIGVIANGSINGVDTEHFKDSYSQETKDELRGTLSFKSSDFIVTYVGRIVKDKGINELIKAFAALHLRYPHLKLLLVGDFEENLNPLEEATMQLLCGHPAIKHVGFQRDIRSYLAITDLFVLPSYREGLPNSLLEAGSFGIPLLASDINGCNEIIEHGYNGFLIPPKDAAQLEKALEELLTDKMLYNTLKANVRSSIIQRFSQTMFWEALKNTLLQMH